jgi:hypothetical protein
MESMGLDIDPRDYFDIYTIGAYVLDYPGDYVRDDEEAMLFEIAFGLSYEEYKELSWDERRKLTVADYKAMQSLSDIAIDVSKQDVRYVIVQKETGELTKLGKEVLDLFLVEAGYNG